MGDSRPSYQVTTSLNSQSVRAQKVPDPFARTRVVVGWRDVLRSAFHWRRLVVEVSVDADRETIERVLELDPNYVRLPGREAG